MTRRSIALFFVVFTIATTIAAADLPPMRWWRRPEIAQTLALTESQQRDLDGIFQQAAAELIDLRADSEKLAVTLRAELDKPQINKQNVLKAASRLADARSRLFEREVAMLVDMRGVLNDEQWTRLRTALENRRERGPEDRPKPPRRRP